MDMCIGQSSLFMRIQIYIKTLKMVTPFDLDSRSDLGFSFQKYVIGRTFRVEEEGFAPNPDAPENITVKLLYLLDEQIFTIHAILPLHMVMMTVMK
jgi:hypothetical protein